MYKKYYCTFADSRMKKSLDRIEGQAMKLNFFDDIFINDENNLDHDFREFFKNKLVKGTRGYGYWVWKPQIILQALKKMQDGDVLLYADVGCHINSSGLDRMKYYFDRAKKTEKGLFVFQEEKRSEDTNLEYYQGNLESSFTKGDLFDYFGVRDNQMIYNTGQIAATCFFIVKSEQSIKIINEWLHVFKSNFSLADGSPSKSMNFEDYREHRHDQSIFSILCKINDIETISSYEIWQRDWRKLKNYAILAKRDKDLNLFWRVERKLRNLIQRN